MFAGSISSSMRNGYSSLRNIYCPHSPWQPTWRLDMFTIRPPWALRWGTRCLVNSMVPELAVRSCTLLFDTKIVGVHHFLVNLQHSFNCTTPDWDPTTVDKNIQLTKHLGTGWQKRKGRELKCFRTSTISLALLSRLSRAARSNVTTWNLGSIAHLAMVGSIYLGSGFPPRNYKLLLDLIQNISPARSHNNPEMDCFQNSRVITTRNNKEMWPSKIHVIQKRPFWDPLI